MSSKSDRLLAQEVAVGFHVIETEVEGLHREDARAEVGFRLPACWERARRCRVCRPHPQGGWQVLLNRRIGVLLEVFSFAADSSLSTSPTKGSRSARRFLPSRAFAVYRSDGHPVD